MDIDVIKRKLLIKYPLFGSTIASVEFVQTNQIPTLGTDGKSIYYNINFLENKTIDEQIFLIAHEVCHIAFNHINRSKNKNKKVWNIATDAIINAFLSFDGLTLPSDAIFIDDAINYDAEELYKLLLKDNKHNNNVDNHNMWNEELTIEQEDISEKELFKENLKLRKTKLEELKNNLVNESKNNEIITNSKIRDIKDIGVNKPLINWRNILKETVNYEVDWSYQNANIEYNILVPNLEERLIPKCEIVLDTSGSIDEDLLKNFLKECKNILYLSRLSVGCFDTRFYGFKEIRDIKDIDNLELKGNGGTDFNVAVNAFTRRVNNKIIFTDGYSSMPQKSMDAIWIVYGKDKINPKGGKVIYIQKNDLKVLRKKS